MSRTYVRLDYIVRSKYEHRFRFNIVTLEDERVIFEIEVAYNEKTFSFQTLLTKK